MTTQIKYYVYYRGNILIDEDSIFPPLVGIARFNAKETSMTWTNPGNSWENVYETAVVPSKIKKEDNLVFDTYAEAIYRLRELVALSISQIDALLNVYMDVMANIFEGDG